MYTVIMRNWTVDMDQLEVCLYDEFYPMRGIEETDGIGCIEGALIPDNKVNSLLEKLDCEIVCLSILYQSRLFDFFDDWYYWYEEENIKYLDYKLVVVKMK